MKNILNCKFASWYFQVHTKILLRCKRSEVKHFSIQELTFEKLS